MMQSDEKLELERLLQNPSTPGYRYSADYYRKYYPNDPGLDNMIAQGARVLDSLRGINTDWFRELIRPNIYQRHNLSIAAETKTPPISSRRTTPSRAAASRATTCSASPHA